MPTLAQIRTHAARLAAICLLVLVAQICAQAQCTFTNGDFETGDLTGWTVYSRVLTGVGNAANWYNYTGTSSPLSSHTLSPPPQGTRAAVSDQNQASINELTQDFTLPPGQSGTLTFKIAYNNLASLFVTLPTLDFNNNQQFRIDLIKTTSAHESVAVNDIYAKLYQTQPGNALFLAPTLMTYDVSGYAGGTARLRFAESVGFNWMNLQVDNVCLSTTRGTIAKPTAVATNGTTNFGGVTVTFPSVTVAGTTSLQQLDPAAQTGPPAGLSFVGPAYDISTTATFTGTVHVCFSLPGITNPTTFSHLRMLHKEGGVWVNLASSMQNNDIKQLCGNVTSLSPFAVGSGSAPTSTESKINGQITTADGAPLGGVVMQLSGSASKRTITAADGSYSFSVNTGEFVTVTPARGNFGFSPHERSVTAVGSVTNAGFTAIPNATPTVNPLDTDLFFIRQQYLDFLSREPDEGGLEYWAKQLGACGADQTCQGQRRIDISAAFFASAEFQQTGNFVYGLYSAGLGRQLTFQEFASDRPTVIGGANLSQSKTSFASQFVGRPEFQQRYSANTSAESFVDAVLANVRENTGVDLSGRRTEFISRYLSGTSVDESRALMLSDAIEQTEFKQANYNPSFVLMQYFGYLGRNADQGGYQFWRDVLDNRQPGNFRGMVCSFLTSAEYQQRFAPVVTHANGECNQ
jgi:hypothetical protein